MDKQFNNILEEAAFITSQDRQKDYGHPSEDMVRIAKMWTGALYDLLGEGKEIPAERVPLLMILVKVSRAVNAYKRDNAVDIAGYAQVYQLVMEALGPYNKNEPVNDLPTEEVCCRRHSERGTK